MQRLGGVRFVAAGMMIMLAGLNLFRPAIPALAAARPPVQHITPVAASLQKQLMQRFPHAAVTVGRITGTSSYALYVSLINQKGATLSSGVGATVLGWYLTAYPKQKVYALYSREQSAGKTSLWEYDYWPASSTLRRYHYSFHPARSYPWTSWHISSQGILQAAHLAQWPRSGAQHA